MYLYAYVRYDIFYRFFIGFYRYFCILFYNIFIIHTIFLYRWYHILYNEIGYMYILLSTILKLKYKIWSCSLYLRLVYIRTFSTVSQFSSITIILVSRYINMILLFIFLFCLFSDFLCIYTFLYIIKSS